MQSIIDQLESTYPHLAAAFASMPQGELHLQRVHDLNNSWQNNLFSGRQRSYTEVVVTAERTPQPEVDTFDIIYAGGGLNLLNAAVMTLRYHMRVLVFDRFTVGAVHREWNISREELRELITVGLFTEEELETVVQREYHDGVVRFHAAHIQIPAAELHLTDVLDIAIDAEKLTALCMQKILDSEPAGKLPNVILHNTTFQKCFVQHSQGVTVDVTNVHGDYHSYGASLLIDGMGSTSPIACQLNCGRPFSLVCPTVGTVAHGYKPGTAADEIAPTIGEVLVSTQDAKQNCQLMWEVFPGADDQVTIYLFYYAQSGQPVDLLELFNTFFALLPDFKDTSTVEIIKPVYGFIPAGYKSAFPWQHEEKVLAYDRILSLGDAAAFQSPLTFCGFGSYVRNLYRITTLLHLAFQIGCLQARDLKHIRASEAVPAVTRALSMFMIAKPDGSEPAWQVNETLNVICHVLNELGTPITNAFFKDKVGWLDYTRIILKTQSYYRHIYHLAFQTLSAVEIFDWIMSWIRLGRQDAMYGIYNLVWPMAQPFIKRWITHPHLVLRITSWSESMDQLGRIRGKRKDSMHM